MAKTQLRPFLSQHAVLAGDVLARPLRVRLETPARFFKHPVDGDAGQRFGGHGLGANEGIAGHDTAVALTGIKIFSNQLVCPVSLRRREDHCIPQRELPSFLYSKRGVKNLQGILHH